LVILSYIIIPIVSSPYAIFYLILNCYIYIYIYIYIVALSGKIGVITKASKEQVNKIYEINK
jgi:roadblock/LC7 domain-containing protein